MGETSIFSVLYRSADHQLKDLTELMHELERCPETGFREYKTSALLAQAFLGLSLKIEPFGDIPGFCCTLDTGKPGPSIAVFCELDALTCPEHPCADPATGAAHCCGHHVQMAAAYGAAATLVESGLAELLSGKVVFIAAPAEECIETDFRNDLRRSGRIRLLGGKQELIARGVLDGIDAALAIHSLSAPWRFALASSMNGFQIKRVEVTGKGAHAAAEPHNGINALDAAQLGLSALNAWRSTFREEDGIRINPIMTEGGRSPSIIPDTARLEMLVRGRSMDAIKSASAKVDKAFSGAAAALDAGAKITSFHGYFPFIASDRLNKLAANVAKSIAGAPTPVLPHGLASTDLGDVSALMPVIQPYVSGCKGGLHTKDFEVTDTTCLTDGAKLLAGMAIELMINDGSSLRHIRSRHYTPLFSDKEEYVRAVEMLFS